MTSTESKLCIFFLLFLFFFLFFFFPSLCLPWNGSAWLFTTWRFHNTGGLRPGHSFAIPGTAKNYRFKSHSILHRIKKLTYKTVYTHLKHLHYNQSRFKNSIDFYYNTQILPSVTPNLQHAQKTLTHLWTSRSLERSWYILENI